MQDSITVIKCSDLKRLIKEAVDEATKDLALPLEADVLLEKPLTLKETAEFFSIEVQTLYNWRKQGIIKGFSIGRRVFFAPSELRAIQARKQKKAI